MDTTGAQALLQRLTRLAGGRETVARLILCAVLAGGHVLLNDAPGTGKTTLAKGLAGVLGLTLRRVQGTPDLLPPDIVGINLWRPDRGRFEFQPGPLFTQVLLCDEINRCAPRTQSALLEAMSERQATIDGCSRPLPFPFIVLATQNAFDGVGTSPLPESQMDRFMFCLPMGRLDAAHEKTLLARGGKTDEEDAPACPPTSLMEQVARVQAGPACIDYIHALLVRSRRDGGGLSTRAGIDIAMAARAHALLSERDFASAEDVQRVFVAAARHRLDPTRLGDAAATAILTDVPVRP